MDIERRGFEGRDLRGRMGLGGSFLLLCLAIGAVFLGGVRLGLHLRWFAIEGIEVGDLWLVRGLPIEAGLALLGALLAGATWARAGFVRGLALLVLLGALIAGGCLVLEPRDRRDAVLAWGGDLWLGLVWRGEDGERLRGPVAVPPDGAFIARPDGTTVRIVNNPDARNPTWAQLQAFLRADRTDEIRYEPGRFVCACFAELLHNNAEVAGWRCAYVTIGFHDDCDGHSLNAFRTTDRGLIFVDCTGSSDNFGRPQDRVVRLAENCEYQPRLLFEADGWTYESMGLVRRIAVCW